MFNCTRPFKFHKWGKWEVVDKGQIVSRGSLLQQMSTSNPAALPEAVTGSFTRQRRTCEACGLVQDKIMKAKV